MDWIRGLLGLACVGVALWGMWSLWIENDWPLLLGVLLTGLFLLWVLNPKADREAEREEAELELIRAATRRLEQDGDIDEDTIEAVAATLRGRR